MRSHALLACLGMRTLPVHRIKVQSVRMVAPTCG